MLLGALFPSWLAGLYPKNANGSSEIVNYAKARVSQQREKGIWNSIVNGGKRFIHFAQDQSLQTHAEIDARKMNEEEAIRILKGKKAELPKKYKALAWK